MEDFRTMEKDVMDNPKSYGPWRCPVMWHRGNRLDQTIDSIMYLLFLGFQKKLEEISMDFMKKRGKNQSFLKYANGLLEGVQRLSIPWCKALPYGTRT